jgi:hypothetical protein
MAVRVHDRDNDSAAPEAGEFRGGGSTDPQHGIGAIHCTCGDCSSGGGKVRIENSGFQAGAGFDRDIGAESDDFLDGSRAWRRPAVHLHRFRQQPQLS